MEEMSYKQMADIFITTAAMAENIVFIIKNHPDWDDEVIASELVEEEPNEKVRYIVSLFLAEIVEIISSFWILDWVLDLQ